MFFYKFYTFNWLRTLFNYCWAVRRRFEWRNDAFRTAAKQDAALDDSKEGVAELPALPPFLQAAQNYFTMQLVEASDWFSCHFHRMDKVRRGLQQTLEKASADHLAAKTNLANRTAELEESKARYMAEFEHEPAYRPWWVFALCFLGVLVLASIDAPVVYRALTTILPDSVWMLYLLTLGVVGLLLFSGHVAGHWWRSNRMGSVAVAGFALGFIVVTSLIRQGSMSNQIKELFPDLPTALLPVFFVCLQGIVLLAAAVVAYYVHEPLRLDFDRRTRESQIALRHYNRTHQEKAKLTRELEMMEPRFIDLDQMALADVAFIHACARKKQIIYNRTYEHHRKNFKTAVPAFLNVQLQFADTDLVQEIRERERRRREAAEKKAALKAIPKGEHRDAA